MTTALNTSRAAEIRAQLGYPIVDGDGHILELTTVFVEYLRDTAGSKIGDAFASSRSYACLLYTSPSPRDCS